MKKIKINDEYFQKYEDDFKFEDKEFDTNKEIEVRIPFEGYYSLKVKCKDPQIAMAEVLKANRDIGITSIEGCEIVTDDMIEEDTYAIVEEDEQTCI